jgi:hypothetical protein
MGEQVNALTYLGIPMIVVAGALALLFMLNVVGSILDFKGKVWPEIVNFRGWRRRKRLEKEKQERLLERLAEKLESFEGHYNPDNIAKRNEWMQWVNNRAEVYDDALDKLLLLQDKLSENNEITLDLYINVNRNRILDFARIVADDNALASREEFNRIYKVNRDYHAILEKYGKENGEVDTAMKLIDEAYDYRMKHHSFIEDIRGYTR